MFKTFPKTKKGKCRVTFQLPKEVNAKTASVVGEFNKWDTHATPMKRKRDGSFSVVMELPVGNEYRFRYWLDNERWENDWQADRYEKNNFGTEDSIVAT